MRVVFATESYSKDMGYIENCLPKELSRLGAEVHVLTTNLQANYRTQAQYQEIYGRFLGAGRATMWHRSGERLYPAPPATQHTPRVWARSRGLGLSNMLRSAP